MGKSKKYPIVAYSGVLIFILYFLAIRPWVKDIKLNRASAYTIAKFVKKESSVEGAPSYLYVFFVNNKKYGGEVVEDSRYNFQVGNCYKVRYYLVDPNCHEVEYAISIDCKDF